MSTTDLPGSSLLAGRYRLVERLGAGGMSVVWRGFDEVLGRQVAVKVLPPSTSTDPSFRRRLRAEAQAAARLSHPHITNVYDYGEATTVDGEPVPYVVMELVDGESLAAVLARSRRLPWPAAVRISSEVAAALAAAHARGIVHRDVTPANVMLTSGGAKVVDFGISALIGENDIDPDGSLLGTPAYLAPERLEGGQVSPATDVYAVGLLIYRTLIGQLPWDVGTTTALLRAHQYTEPEPLPPVEGLPSAVSALIARCLEKRPADRPSSAELAHVLGTVSAGVPASRAYVPDWAENGEDTTILPSARRDTDAFGRVRPGLAQVHSTAPGRGVAAVPAAEAPVSPAPAGAPVPPAVSVAEVEAAVGPVSSPPQRGARNSRFGPVPPAPAVASAAGATAPPIEDAAPAGPALRPAFGGDDAFRPPPREGGSPASPARPAGAGGHGGRGNTPPARPGGGSPPNQNRPGSAATGPSGPGGNGGITQRRRVLIISGSIVGAVLVASAAVAALSQDGTPKTPNAGSTTLTGSNKCVVSYAVWEDKDNKFRAAITLANRENSAIKDWKLWFLMPGDQVVSGNGGLKLDQQGQGVTVLGRTPLSPQQTKTLEFTGRYRASNAAPMVFELGGETCQTFVSPAPGAPSRPVEHLTNGTVRLGPVPTKDTPIPGISINPGGVAVPVPVTTTAPAGVTPTTTTPGVVVDPGGGGNGNGDDDGDDDETPVEPSAPTTTPAVTPTTTEPAVTETTPAVTDTFTDPGDTSGNEPLPGAVG
ncbi:serine/threonine-protein kinase [Actinoplanes sp. CA-051413]|uniref:serine/threonine-protein kinase n=1 Tax=Actinoplanes sp. CA-051413 TaxID=3239899 RepID=UPI003D95C25A